MALIAAPPLLDVVIPFPVNVVLTSLFIIYIGSHMSMDPSLDSEEVRCGPVCVLCSFQCPSRYLRVCGRRSRLSVPRPCILVGCQEGAGSEPTMTWKDAAWFPVVGSVRVWFVVVGRAWWLRGHVVGG